MPSRIVIGGGSGFVGGYLTRLLRTKGYETINVSRQSGPSTISWSDLHRDGLPEDTTAVVNLAGENIMNRWKRLDDDFKADLVHSRVDTTRQLVAAIAAARVTPRVFVSASAIGRYRASETVEYSEDTPLEPPHDFFSQLVADWEKAAEIPSNVSCRQVTLRIGLVLARNGGIVNDIFMPFFFGLGGRMGSGRQWFPWIHAQDVAGIISHAIETDGVTGVLNAVAPETARSADFTSTFARAMWRPALVPLPGFAFNLMFGPERAKMILEGQKVIPKRTIENGYTFIYPDLKSACKEFAKLAPALATFKD